MIYGDKIKALRERCGFTQEALGKYLQVTKQAYHHFESEYTIIPIKHLNSLANYFNVSIDYLFGFTKERNYKISKNDIDLNIVKVRLKEFRKENKLSQEKLAAFLNVSKGTIGNYESNRNIIATPFLYTICRKYHISADYLLGKINRPKYI